MPDWAEIRAHVGRRYQLLVDEDGWLGMAWTFTRDDETVVQRVKVERGRAFDKDWLIIRAAVCLAAKIDAGDALRFNARLAVGALVIMDDRCYLRVTLPMDTVVYGDLDQAIEHVARETARLRRPRRIDQTPFNIFED